MGINWIRQRRNEININQSTLSARLQLEGLDISRAAVSHWETGRYNPPLSDPEFRQIMAKALELSVPELLHLAGYEIQSAGDEMAVRASLIVSRLPPDIQKHALEYLLMLEKQHAATQ